MSSTSLRSASSELYRLDTDYTHTQILIGFLKAAIPRLLVESSTANTRGTYGTNPTTPPALCLDDRPTGDGNSKKKFPGIDSIPRRRKLVRNAGTDASHTVSRSLARTTIKRKSFVCSQKHTKLHLDVGPGSSEMTPGFSSFELQPPSFVMSSFPASALLTSSPHLPISSNTESGPPNRALLPASTSPTSSGNKSTLSNNSTSIPSPQVLSASCLATFPRSISDSLAEEIVKGVKKNGILAEDIVLPNVSTPSSLSNPLPLTCTDSTSSQVAPSLPSEFKPISLVMSPTSALVTSISSSSLPILSNTESRLPNRIPDPFNTPTISSSIHFNPLYNWTSISQGSSTPSIPESPSSLPPTNKTSEKLGHEVENENAIPLSVPMPQISLPVLPILSTPFPSKHISSTISALTDPPTSICSSYPVSTSPTASVPIPLSISTPVSPTTPIDIPIYPNQPVSPHSSASSHASSSPLLSTPPSYPTNLDCTLSPSVASIISIFASLSLSPAASTPPTPLPDHLSLSDPLHTIISLPPSISQDKAVPLYPRTSISTEATPPAIPIQGLSTLLASDTSPTSLLSPPVTFDLIPDPGRNEIEYTPTPTTSAISSTSNPPIDVLSSSPSIPLPLVTSLNPLPNSTVTFESITNLDHNEMHPSPAFNLVSPFERLMQVSYLINHQDAFSRDGCETNFRL